MAIVTSPRLRRQHAPVSLALASVAVLGSLVLAAPTAAAPPAASVAPPAAATPTAVAAPALEVLGQTQWVKAGEQYDLTLGVTSKVPRSELGISLSVYSPPIGQSSFDETLSGDTSNETLLSDTQTVKFSALSTNSAGDVSMHVGLAAGSSIPPSSPLDLDLGCSPGSCSGVYPLRVQLMDTATGSVLSDLVTDIIFVESGLSSRLRVALDVPLGAAPSAPTRSGAPGALPVATAQRLSDLTDALESTEIPMTVVPQPQTVQAAAQGSPLARSLADALSALSDDASIQVMDSSYVWVNPAALTHAGLGADLATQQARGAAVMAAHGIQTSGATAIIRDGIDTATLDALESAGITRIVVPQQTLAPVTGRFAGPAVQTFHIYTGHGHQLQAALTDPGFESELVDDQHAPGVLGADQLLADLALVAFEEPDASWVRGVVLAPPLDWSPTHAFLTTLLSGLAHIPVLDPVTTTGFFAQVAAGDDAGNADAGNGWPATRQLASDSASVSSSLSSSGYHGGATSLGFAPSALRRARTKLTALASIVHARAALAALTDSLLASESVLLSPHGQKQVISDLDHVVTARSAVVSLSSDHTIRLTSQNATFPITLLRRVGYPVTVVLSLSSDKLDFLHGTNPQRVTLTQRVQSVDVDVRARTSGDFPVSVSVTSPTGNLVIASAKFTVRSLSTSFVAIALSAVAVLVLLVWWGRTLLSGKRRSRKPHSLRRAHAARSQAHAYALAAHSHTHGHAYAHTYALPAGEPLAAGKPLAAGEPLGEPSGARDSTS